MDFVPKRSKDNNKMPSSSKTHSTSSRYPIGTSFTKFFPAFGFFTGTVVSYDSASKWYRVEYAEDNEVEDMTQEELQDALKASKAARTANEYPIGTRFVKYFPRHGMFRAKVRSYDVELQLYWVQYEDGDEEQLSGPEIQALLLLQQTKKTTTTQSSTAAGTATIATSASAAVAAAAALSSARRPPLCSHLQPEQVLSYVPPSPAQKRPRTPTPTPNLVISTSVAAPPTKRMSCPPPVPERVLSFTQQPLLRSRKLSRPATIHATQKQHTSWKDWISALYAYKMRFGHVLVSCGYTTDDNLQLGHWVARQRRRRARNSKRLSAAKIQQLTSMGFVWNTTTTASSSLFLEPNKRPTQIKKDTIKEGEDRDKYLDTTTIVVKREEDMTTSNNNNNNNNNRFHHHPYSPFQEQKSDPDRDTHKYFDTTTLVVKREEETTASNNSHCVSPLNDHTHTTTTTNFPKPKNRRSWGMRRSLPTTTTTTTVGSSSSGPPPPKRPRIASL